METAVANIKKKTIDIVKALILITKALPDEELPFNIAPFVNSEFYLYVNVFQNTHYPLYACIQYLVTH